MPSVRYTIFLVTGMLITGACNTLLNKLQDKQCVKDCDTPNPKHFEQPVIQTLNMFMGEAFCLLACFAIQYYSKNDSIRLNSNDSFLSEQIESGVGFEEEIDDYNNNDNNTATNDNSINNNNQLNIDSPSTLVGNDSETLNAFSDESNHDLYSLESANKTPLKGKTVLFLWLPSILDICGTTLMNIGLIYVAASVYQMLRGAVVIFTGFFSVLFLKRELSKSQWIALFLVMTGVSIVGMSNSIIKSPSVTQPINNDNDELIKSLYNNNSNGHHISSKNVLGVCMVILAQIFTALQFIIEEKIMSYYEVSPLKTVGLEGSFGLFTVLAAIPFLYTFIGRNHPGGFFDLPDGFSQVFSHSVILFISIGCICSIAFFNWFGLSVTHAVSATSRSTIDTCRTVLIWMISLYLGWESFNWLQVLGFLVLIYGTFIFNGLVDFPIQFSNNDNTNNNRNSNENRPLLDESFSPLSPEEDNHLNN